MKTQTKIPVFLNDPVKEDLEPNHGHEAETHHEADTDHHPKLQGSPHCLLTWDKPLSELKTGNEGRWETFTKILKEKSLCATKSNNFRWLSSFCPNGPSAFLFILSMQKLALKYLSSLFHISPFSQSCFHFCLLKVSSAELLNRIAFRHTPLIPLQYLLFPDIYLMFWALTSSLTVCLIAC